MKEKITPEDLFKDALGDLVVNPSGKSWADISDQLDTQSNTKIQQKFEQFEIPPKPEVWNGIKEQLPYNLRIRRQLNWFAKIAAILLIGMLFSVGSNMLKQKEQQAAVIPAPPTPSSMEIVETVTPILEVEEKNDFVFDVNKKKEIASKLMEEEEINSLLDFILDDSDDIAAAIDETVIQESMTPADELPMEGLTLVVPEDDVEEVPTTAATELTIKIPLVVVEENEIESLIDMYEANASHGVASQPTNE